MNDKEFTIAHLTREDVLDMNAPTIDDMLQKISDKKQIEEIAKVIFERGVALDGTDFIFGLKGSDHFERIATALYNAGYRKLPENAVVFSGEEYRKGVIERESMRKQITELFNDRERIRKETAKEIFTELYMFVSSDYLCGLRNPYKSNNYMGLVERLAKGYSVDLGE